MSDYISREKALNATWQEPIGKVFVTSKFCPNCGAKMKGVSE